jgi:hypothetical protein
LQKKIHTLADFLWSCDPRIWTCKYAGLFVKNIDLIRSEVFDEAYVDFDLLDFNALYCYGWTKTVPDESLTPIIRVDMSTTFHFTVTTDSDNCFMFSDRAHLYVHACNETNIMHYLSSVYSVTIPLHVSGLLTAHHQEVTMYVCDNWYVPYVLVDCHIYTSLPPDDGLLASPKHVEV